MDGPDTIHLANVLLSAHIGVSEAERAATQPLGLFLTLHLAGRCEQFSDDIARTANYSSVRQTALALNRGASPPAVGNPRGGPRRRGAGRVSRLRGRGGGTAQMGAA